MKERVQQFWMQASPMERWLIGGGFGLLLVVVLVFYVWQPLVHDRQKLRANLPQLRVSAEQMRLNAAEVVRLKTLPSSASMANGGIRGAVENSAAAFKLRDSLSQVSVEGDGRISITMATVPFDNWVRWLGHLQEQYRIRLESCRVEALPQPGMVRIKAVLAGKAG
ncbi:general secretion pathway protein M [Sulfuricella sp. T08]|uniref:type II secretion system protein GspM n=1 Tax=Sulfuricella sp. T08 TaxID=1632857 RepID=UPI00061798D2|nr:type II secretion system protein M [Sulfuricella sp. T08]GAO34651.1 general secretion pathway protein M [Sulfuricella sp. T08]